MYVFLSLLLVRFTFYIVDYLKCPSALQWHVLGLPLTATFQKEISEHAKSIENIFKDNITGQEFFDLVHMWFASYDQHNQHYKKRNFRNDVEFIIQNITNNLRVCDNHTLVSDRADGYFYILNRIDEYLLSQHESINRTIEFRKLLLEHWGNEFKFSRGTRPSLHLIEKATLQKIDVKRIFTSFGDVDNIPILLQFFAICKLAFQSSKVVDEPNRFTLEGHTHDD